MTSPSYCAPCIADLALVRDAVTSVAGTASCMAHAVLLTHSSDDPGRRRHRLDALRDLANSKAETAEPAEQVKLELLVQEYGLAGAMDMGGPARRAPQQPRQGTPSPPGEGRKSRRGRVRPGDRPAGEHGPRHGERPGGERPGGERPGGERPGGERPGGGRDDHPAEAGETAPASPAPGLAGEGAPVEATSTAPEQPTPAAPATPEQPTPAAPATPEQPTPAAPQPTPEQSRPESAAPVPPTSDPDA